MIHRKEVYKSEESDGIVYTVQFLDTEVMRPHLASQILRAAVKDLMVRPVWSNMSAAVQLLTYMARSVCMLMQIQSRVIRVTAAIAKARLCSKGHSKNNTM